MKKQIILNIIITLLSAGALAVSIKSCNISSEAEKNARESNRIADEALKTAQEFFLKENRPYIILKPNRFKENNFFYNYEISRLNNSVKIDFSYEMKNIGTVAAKKVLPFRKLLYKPGGNTDLKYKLLSKEITLGPTEDIRIRLDVKMEWDEKEQFEKYVDEIISEKGTWFVLQLGVDYVSEVDTSLKYSTLVKNKILKDQAMLLKSEFEKIVPKDLLQ